MQATRLLAGSVFVSLLCLGLGATPNGVVFNKGDDRIDVVIAGKPFTTYYYAANLPRPFFHPLRTADGKVVTRGFPMVTDAPAESQDRDHPHHRSCWFTFGDVDGVDYWGEGAKVQGRIVNRSVDKMEGGEKKGVLAATMDWLDNTGRKILVQKQEVIFHGDASRRYMDYTIVLTPAERDVTFRDTKEGMFAVRLATPLKEKNGGVITNSKGAVGMKDCWGKSAEWVDYSGQLDGSKVGVTIMDHPGSFRHPTTWHVRDYGLFAANPFGLRDFTGDKAKDGSHVIATGKNITFRYRILIHPGNLQEAKVADEYGKYVREVK
jgi:hypothetical protein